MTDVTITELFLHTYFLTGCAVGKLTSARSLFDMLYTAFLLPEEDRDTLYAQTQSERVCEIETYADYARLCRTRIYYALSGEAEILPEDLRDILAVKGDALRKAKQCKYETSALHTEATVYKALEKSANEGITASLCALGLLQCEGIFLPKNEYLGRKNLDRAARWNDVAGILLALRYDEQNRARNMQRLYTVTHDTLYRQLYETATQVYGVSEARAVPESKMIRKAFGMGILQPEQYAPQYSRFIYSEILSRKDKEQALFSGHKEEIVQTLDLPLKLRFGEIAFTQEALDALPLAHDKEREEICRNMANADLRTDAAFRPLCICGGEDYTVRLYLSALRKSFPSAHVERIDVADLGDHDLEPTANNIFVRSCDEDAQNVYLLYCKGEIREGVMSAVKSFLQSEKRRRFRLLHPGVIVDLSAILPVCLCDKANARALKSLCDVVTLTPVRGSEREALTAYIAQTKAEQYKLQSVQIDEAAQKFLAELSVDRLERLVEKAVRSHRGVAQLTLTEEILKAAYSGDAGAKTYGFGGADYDESK